MAEAGRLPAIVGEDEKWELVREDRMGRVFLNWAGAALVRFEAATMAGLPWEFTPVQPVVRAKPGRDPADLLPGEEPLEPPDHGQGLPRSRLVPAFARAALSAVKLSPRRRRRTETQRVGD